MKLISKLILIYIKLNFYRLKSDINYSDLNFKRIEFTNFRQIKTFIFKKKFFNIKDVNVYNFDYLNFTNNLGGKLGLSLSMKSIFEWFKVYKNKLDQSWGKDLPSKRLINLIYNYEFIKSSAIDSEIKNLNKVIYFHMMRILFEFKYKKFNQISSYELKAYVLSLFILKKDNIKNLYFYEKIINSQIDRLGVHKSYNILEHSKFINNLNELKNIFLYFDESVPQVIDKSILLMSSILIQYFHKDGSIPLFNGANNNYTKLIYDNINKEEFLKLRDFSNSKNGIAFYNDRYKKIFFDVVQPSRDSFNNLSAGTLSMEISSDGEKIITNCGASENKGANPEFLRYSAAHSTIIIQNTNISEIKQDNPHIKYPQKVSFNYEENENETIFEGSHNGYSEKFNKVIKRKLEITKRELKISGEDSIISTKKINKKTIYHIRFHLMPNISFNITNNKKGVIIKTKSNKIWLFKTSSELRIEDSILVDNNITQQIKQIVIRGVALKNKQVEKWSLKRI